MVTQKIPTALSRIGRTYGKAPFLKTIITQEDYAGIVHYVDNDMSVSEEDQRIWKQKMGIQMDNPLQGVVLKQMIAFLRNIHLDNPLQGAVLTPPEIAVLRNQVYFFIYKQSTVVLQTVSRIRLIEMFFANVRLGAYLH